MKRIYSVIPLFLILFLMVACGPDQPDPVDVVEPTDVPPTTAPAQNDVSPRPTVTAVSPESYPAPDAEGALDGYPVLAVTAVSIDGYPVIDYAALPTRNPYPAEGEYILVSVPMGNQCAESMDYPTMQDAVWVLQAEGIAVFDRQVTELMVCTACGCPTSTHYLMEILATDLAEAEELGWVLSEEQ